MRAIRLHEHTGTAGLRLDEVPEPSIEAGGVLVQVLAAGINPIDWKIADGLGKERFGHPLPHTLGCEISGVVRDVGEGVTSLRIGDEVYGYLNLARGGGFADLALVEPNEVAPKPGRLNHLEAACVPIGGLTAWQALVDTADVRPGQRVLIHGASGSVGSLAVQIAKQRGATVLATASAANEELVLSAGADTFIDYRSQRFEEHVGEIDVVLDTVGGATQARSFAILRPGGILVSIVGPPRQPPTPDRDARATFVAVQPDAEQLGRLAAWIDSGEITPHLAHVVDFAAGIDAPLAARRSGETTGKTVLLL